MTGFGRAEAELDGRKVTIEIKAVNHRYLDINIRLPRSLGFVEESVRKIIKDRLTRGRVDVFINYYALVDGVRTARADTGLIGSYLSAARQAGKAVRLTDDLKLSHILQIPDAIVIDEAQDDETKQTGLVKLALESALEYLTEMRAREGKELEENILECLIALEQTAGVIDSKKNDITKAYSEKLRLRIAELIEDSEIDETRFNAEVAYIADKADITEEIVRLNTHINQFRNSVLKEMGIGRKLDFMVQEMNRELNTIGSKSQDINITNAVIEGKSIVEKIREQVQNIE
ncbi:MAG: YicC/YloC family endoribonuclease [Christensenellales bacterium]|jgi:uncharacterized protein (TIGR00255 family)